MPFFARTSWPADHRDDVVAGVLVAAVIVVLGYASGVGRGAPAGTENFASPPPASSPPASSPAPTSPAPAPPPGSTEPADSAPVDYVQLPADSPGQESAGDAPEDGAGTPSPAPGSGAGGGTSPGPTPSAPRTPSPSPSPQDTPPCADGQVHLLQPVVTTVVGTATGLLDGLLGAVGSPSPAAGTGPAPSGTPGALCLPLPTQAPVAGP